MHATLDAATQEGQELTAKSEADQEQLLRLGIHFEPGEVRPRYRHVYYTGDPRLPKSVEGVPEGIEVHPGYVVYDVRRLRIELGIDDPRFFFQRDPTGMPMIQQVHLTNPIFPPLHGAFLGRQELSGPSIPETKWCTLLWRDSGTASRTASYALYATDVTSLSSTLIPLAIGNLRRQDLMQSQAEEGLLSGRGVPYELVRDAVRPAEVDLNLELHEEAGQLRFSIFDYAGLPRDAEGKLSVMPDPLFRFDPSKDFVVRFRARHGLEFVLQDGAPYIVWFNTVTAQQIEQPRRVEVFCASREEFFMRFLGAASGQPRPATGNWLNSFFVAGERDGVRLWTDPTVVEDSDEVPDP